MLSVQKSVHIFSVSSKTSGKLSENNVDIKRKKYMNFIDSDGI